MEPVGHQTGIKPIVIAIDMMGGDHGLTVTAPAVTACLSDPACQAIHFLLVGKEEAIKKALGPESLKSPRITIQHASEVISMDEAPVVALKQKKDASMRIAMNSVKEKRAHACISAGNTGALMAISKFVLRMLPGLDRPAIMGRFPSRKGPVHVLDLGANVDNSAEHLHQFAVMGRAAVRVLQQKDTVSVGLLNVGHEAIKGNRVVKEAHELLDADEKLGYVGSIEPNDLFSGDTDVVVCDGFVGNITLKACEGVVPFLKGTIRHYCTSTWLGRLLAPLMVVFLKGALRAVDPERFNGACLLGLRGIVVKSHGSASVKGFVHAIKTSIRLAEASLPDRVQEATSDHWT